MATILDMQNADFRRAQKKKLWRLDNYLWLKSVYAKEIQQKISTHHSFIVIWVFETFDNITVEVSRLVNVLLLVDELLIIVKIMNPDRKKTTKIPPLSCMAI